MPKLIKNYNAQIRPLMAVMIQNRENREQNSMYIDI